jgi:tRNA(Ile)-lysidine synthase
MRYAFLIRAAGETGAGRIATAHNADDNAETVLLHLTRGSGLQGLTGIPPRRGSIVRPLLTTSRQEIETYLTRNGVPHVEDSSNLDPVFVRNKLRHEILPLLRSINRGSPRA